MCLVHLLTLSSHFIVPYDVRFMYPVFTSGMSAWARKRQFDSFGVSCPVGAGATPAVPPVCSLPPVCSSTMGVSSLAFIDRASSFFTCSSLLPLLPRLFSCTVQPELFGFAHVSHSGVQVHPLFTAKGFPCLLTMVRATCSTCSALKWPSTSYALFPTVCTKVFFEVTRSASKLLCHISSSVAAFLPGTGGGC